MSDMFFADDDLTCDRLCGSSRQKDSLYLECRFGPGGRPLEEFLLCPPVRLSEEILDGLSRQGMHLFPQQVVSDETIYHILDWISEAHYKNVSAFLREGAAINFSRKIQPSFPFEKLSAASRYLPVHARGWIENYEEYFKYEPYTLPREMCCPLRLVHHRSVGDSRMAHGSQIIVDPCARIWMQDIEGGESASERAAEFGITDASIAARLVKVSLPCRAGFFGLRKPDGVEPVYAPAIIASLPIGRIAVIKGDGDNWKRKAEKARQQSAYPVVEVDG